MTALSLKNILHKLVVETEDVEVLSQVEQYFRSLLKNEDDWWETLSEKQKKTIEIGFQQIEAGKTIPYEEVRTSVLNRINAKK